LSRKEKFIRTQQEIAGTHAVPELGLGRQWHFTVGDNILVGFIKFFSTSDTLTI